MVVGRESCFFQSLRLTFIQHAQSAAHFHSGRGHSADHLDHAVKLRTIFHLAPSCAHAETIRARSFGAFGAFAHLIHAHQVLALKARVVVGALRAISAVFAAATGFNREEGRFLNIATIIKLSVHLGCLEYQVRKRQLIELENFLNRPIVANSSSHCPRFILRIHAEAPVL